MTVWFTSDTHFGHANIIGYSKRPFASVEEMDAVLIGNWNARVQPQDEVWHLGDLTFRSEKSADAYLKRLNGRKHLIWGNHDSEKVRQLDGWASSQPYAELALDGRKIVLLHYGLRVWNKSHHGALHFYGHSHGSLPGDRQSCDVGIDNPACAYMPWRLEEIERHLATLPERVPVDHHGVREGGTDADDTRHRAPAISPGCPGDGPPAPNACQCRAPAPFDQECRGWTLRGP